ncbi:MAG: PD-(D/E)XK nuclease family protein [Bacteroidales bacterium]
MIITYLRSSSYNTWSFCQHKYFLDYTLNYHSPANIAAEKGTIVHMALEILARAKLSQQNNQSVFNTEIGEFDAYHFNYESILKNSYDHFSKKTPQYSWNNKHYEDCLSWFMRVVNSNMNPLNHHIICPEQYFDIEIQKDWSYYEYNSPHGKISGYLRLKGTIDLIIRHSDDIYEIIDYKTGKRKDWVTGEEKTYDSLQNEPQFHIYHYVAHQIYPGKKFIFTVYYINDGGVYSMVIDSKAEEMIKKRFIDIKNTQIPKLIFPDWKCERLCFFYKTDVDGNSVNSYNMSACRVVHEELQQLGMNKVLMKYSKDKTYSDYGTGGGKKGAL